MKRKTILFVALAHSIHAAHWMNLLADSEEYEILLYPALYTPAHPSLSNKVEVLYPSLFGTGYSHTGRFHKFRRFIDFIRCKLAGAPCDSYYQSAKRLRNIIKTHTPDIMHALEFQHSGYLALEALDHIPSEERPAFGVTNWGNDLFHYQQFPKHLRLLKSLMKAAQFYSCECTRDFGFATALGFTGRFWPIVPGSSGMNIPMIQEILRNAIPPSMRKGIMIKGYLNFSGRAFATLDALKQCTAELRPYIIYVFSAHKKVKTAFSAFADENALTIKFLTGITQREMFEHYSQSRCYISTGISDGISTSVLESMALGCFPIQSDSACCLEWFEHGKTGFATSAAKLNENDVSTIVSAIKQTLSSNAMVDEAAPINQQIVAARADSRDVQKILLSEYAALC